jgi:outer membrane lipoprotein-sorting protein
VKKIILFLICIFLLSGCGNHEKTKLVDELDRKVKNSKNYQITATLEIFRNEEKFIYDIVSTYKKGEYFKVELTNKSNKHKQIIIKDSESVYVLTPSLNKNFKFQSEWPYNNSQIYLLQPIILDVNNDKQSKFEKNDEGYVVTSAVNFSNEKQFKYQRIYFDKEKNIKKVEVIDDSDNVLMCLRIVSIEYDIKLETDFFDVNKYQKNTTDLEEDEKTSDIVNEIVYPMYVPTDTYLSSQHIVNTELGERVILTFSGASEFTLIQENLNNNQNIEYIYGDPYLILDTIGSVTDYSVSWISEGTEYSLMSDNLSIDELLVVAQSISVKTVGK